MNYIQQFIFIYKKDNTTLTIPSNLFLQNVSLNIDSLKTSIELSIVFGTKDNLVAKLNETWTIMNQMWSDFKQNTLINEHDLWPASLSQNERTLFNAKLYPIFHSHLNVEEMRQLNLYFWLDIIKHPRNPLAVNKWRDSLRLSLEEIGSLVNLEKMFENRRRLFNIVSTRHLAKSVIEKRPINFKSLIQNAVHDGYAHEILKLLDEGNEKINFLVCLDNNA